MSKKKKRVDEHSEEIMFGMYDHPAVGIDSGCEVCQHWQPKPEDDETPETATWGLCTISPIKLHTEANFYCVAFRRREPGEAEA